MASIAGTSMSMASVSSSFKQCLAKPETVDNVCDIVKKQLAVPDGSVFTGEFKFAVLEAFSLDMVEIVIGLEEEFGISVEEESAQSITNVHEVAYLISKLFWR